jgi:hypothetical protein
VSVRQIFQNQSPIPRCFVELSVEARGHDAGWHFRRNVCVKLHFTTITLPALRPGTVFKAGRISAECRDGTLWMMLPSGRSIAYNEPRLVEGKFENTADIAFKDNQHGKWKDVTEWYGTFVENAVQATARDLLAAALIRLEAAGFPIIAHVHDEVIAEVPAGDDRTAEFVSIMTAAPDWADGLPIAGKPWERTRFLKSGARQ